MRISEWIKSQLELLRAMVIPSDEAAAPPASSLAAIQCTASPDHLELKFPSSPANVSTIRKSIEEFCAAAGLDIPACEEVGLVVNEALANVIRHAYDGATDKPIEVNAYRQPDGVKISIRDWGNGIDPSTVPRPEHDPLIPGGLGLICLRRLMDDVAYQPQPDGMLLTMTRITSGSKAGCADEGDDK